MIKIVLKDPKALEADYLKRMVTPLQKMIDCLDLCLADLESPRRITVNPVTIDTYGDFTRKTLMILDPAKSFIKKDFEPADYQATVLAYVNGINKLSDIDIPKLRAFLKDLSAWNSLKLEEFLICPAEKLSQRNKDIIASQSLNEKEIKVICLAISYGIGALSEAAKGFFRKHNLVKTCPYCNYENAEYIPEKRKTKEATARVHQLDHFFSQTDHPLLELCMYNLVPSGISCNSRTCKGQICFKDEFHLNPYIDGFNSDMMFVPERIGLKTIRISLDFLGTPGSTREMQIIGDASDTSKVGYQRGNKNVFKLQGLYENLKEESDLVLKYVNRRIAGRSSNLRFFEKMVGLDLKASHKKWYIEEIRTPFDPSEFNNKPLSKFNRDIHDSYVMENLNWKNRFLKDLIKYP